MNKDLFVFAFLLVLGLLQMTGKITRQPALAGIGAASNASPHPKVFSAVLGLETYSSKFYLDWHDPIGNFKSLQLTPSVYSNIRGPYNRRNVYGAALAYGPVLASNEMTRQMFEDVLSYAIAGDAPLLRELGINPEDVIYPVIVRLEVESGTELEAELPLQFEVEQNPDA